jgi:hypothetical protein
MGVIVEKGGVRVYRVSPTARFILGLLFLVGPIVGAVIEIPHIIAEGGGYVQRGLHATSRSTWMPTDVIIPYGICASLLFMALGVYCLLSAVNAKVFTDADGLRQVDWRGREVFRARWDQIAALSEDTKGNTVVSAPGGTARIDNNLPDIVVLLAEIKERTGLTPS